MMNTRLLLGIIGLFLFNSCSRSSCLEDRERALFINPTFGYEIPIDSLQTLEDLVVLFDRVYCENISEDKWPILYFDTNKKEMVNPQVGKNILAIGIEPAPCPSMMFEYDYSLILEVVKDGYNLEVEGQRVELDSLASYVSKQYLNYGVNPLYSKDPQNNGIWLITNKDDKLINLNKHIAQLIEGYVQMAHKYANIQFGKSLESLDDKEFKELKNTLTFRLSFKFSDEPPRVINGLM